MKATFLLSACLLALAPALHAQQRKTMTVAGTTRSMLVYAPKGLPEHAPLIISLHGANQDANYQMNQTKWNNLADTAKVLVVYPEGINKMWDISGSSDTRFVEAVIKRMAADYHIDRNRVYVTGFSMGSMLTYHCMSRLGNIVAAFGPVSGIPVDYRAPSAPRAVPIMHIHGTADDVVKYNGDPNHAAGGYGSIPDYVKKWAVFDSCDVAHPVTISPYPAGHTWSGATRVRYLNKANGVEVTLISIKGKGHWHSNDPSSVVSTEELWRFFKGYSLHLPESAGRDTLGADVVFADEWSDASIAVGEGIPEGWKRINTKADGTLEVTPGGTANTSGARLKDFTPGGDFDTGFYLSARDNARCRITYGQYPAHRLRLSAGQYELSFRSAYWDDGSEQQKATFDVGVAMPSSGKNVLSATALPSAGNLKGGAAGQVTGSQLHTLKFNVEKGGDYALWLQMAQGWSAVAVGSIIIRKVGGAATTVPAAQAARKDGNTQWYSLQGQPAAHPKHGVFVSHGKKIVAK